MSSRLPALALLPPLLLLLLGGLSLGPAVAAPGERPIRLNVKLAEGMTSCGPDELIAAVRLRAVVVAEPGLDATDVTVTAPEPGWIEIASEGRSRRIDVRDAAALDAARLVALMVVDLVRTAAPPPPRAPAASATALPRSPPAPSRSAPASSQSPPARAAQPTSLPLAVAATAGLGLRTTDAGPGLVAGLEAQAASGRRGRAALSVAFEPVSVIVHRSSGDATLSLTMIPVRAGAGVRLGWLELRAGAVARPYWLSGLGSRSGLVWGGFLAAAGVWPAQGAWAAFGIVGVDAHPQPIAFTVDEQRVLSMHTLAPFVSAGAVWRAGKS